MIRHAMLASLVLALTASAAPAQQATDAVAPEAATPSRPLTETVTARRFMVVTANPLATKAGEDVLAEGGSAADAAVAVQAVLGLVEPQSSGLGGGAFAVWFDKASGTLTTFDGRETAPASATPDMFMGPDGKPLGFMAAVVGGRSVGVPGTPALMETLHTRFGKRQWRTLLQPAIALARDGFTVSPRLAGLVAEEKDSLASHPATAAYFLPAGQPLRTGDRLRNPAYADTLEALQTRGAEGFYSGPVADGLVAAVTGAANPGGLTLADLAAYRVTERPPVCFTWRALDVCGMGPPSSGALTLGQTLLMLENFDLKALGPTNPESWRLIGDASRLAFADRERYMADPAFVRVPAKGLLDKAYLSERAKLLDGTRALETVEPGEPPSDHTLNLGDGLALELPSTSHFVIVDQAGNALSMTTTIEAGFGSRVMSGGFLLNNELTDFSFAPADKEGRPVANRVEPGKRPRSSMTPTIVMKDGKPVLLIGSPGGSQIIGYVAQALIGIVEWGLDAQAAVAAPHLVNRFGTFGIEQGTSAEALVPALEAMGFKTKIDAMSSGLHAIAIAPDGTMTAGIDPRREGAAAGR